MPWVCQLWCFYWCIYLLSQIFFFFWRLRTCTFFRIECKQTADYQQPIVTYIYVYLYNSMHYINFHFFWTKPTYKITQSSGEINAVNWSVWLITLTITKCYNVICSKLINKFSNQQKHSHCQMMKYLTPLDYKDL